MSKQQERTNIHYDLVTNYGYSSAEAGAIANMPNIHNAHDAYRKAKAAGPRVQPAPQQAPQAPKPPKRIKPPVQPQATQASAGQGVRQARGSKKRTRVSDLRISRPKVNTQLSIGAGGTGLNIGGY